MTTPCRATTKTGRPCKASASRWPRGVDGDPHLCGRHLPVDLRDIRDAGFAEEERRRTECLDAREPACWTWEPAASDRTGDERDPLVAFADWHADRCAVCGFRAPRLVKDHDHETGLIRGLLCRSCNGQEPHDGGLFQRYRMRSPADILGIRLVYVDPIHGPAEPRPRRRQLDNHPAYALAARLGERLQPEPAE